MGRARSTAFQAIAFVMMAYHFTLYLWRQSMSKTLSGMILLGGLAVAVIAGRGGQIAANSNVNDPSLDWYYNLLSFGSMAGIVLGLGMFFAGAMFFARK